MHELVSREKATTFVQKNIENYSKLDIKQKIEKINNNVYGVTLTDQNILKLMKDTNLSRKMLHEYFNLFKLLCK